MIWKGLYLMLKKRKKTEMLTFNFLFFSFLPRLLTPHLSKILLCYDLCLLIVDVPLYSKKNVVKSMCESAYQKMLSNQCVNPVKESDSDTIIMVIVLVAGVGGVFILFALMALCYR